MKNTENIVKVDTESFIEMCQKIELLESHVTALKTENEILRDENEIYFETCNDLIKTLENYVKKTINSMKTLKLKLTID